jgi:hypothetical protein
MYRDQMSAFGCSSCMGLSQKHYYCSTKNYLISRKTSKKICTMNFNTIQDLALADLITCLDPESLKSIV